MNINGVDNLNNPTEVDIKINTLHYNSGTRFHCTIANRRKVIKLTHHHSSTYWVDLIDNHNDPNEVNFTSCFQITQEEFEQINRFLDDPLSVIELSGYKIKIEEPVISRPVCNAIMELEI